MTNKVNEIVDHKYCVCEDGIELATMRTLTLLQDWHIYFKTDGKIGKLKIKDPPENRSAILCT